MTSSTGNAGPFLLTFSKIRHVLVLNDVLYDTDWHQILVVLSVVVGEKSVTSLHVWGGKQLVARTPFERAKPGVWHNQTALTGLVVALALFITPLVMRALITSLWIFTIHFSALRRQHKVS